MSDRTVGQVFTTPTGKQYRPSMFATCTLPSYGPVLVSGAPKHPGTYDYRRAALDALHFSKLCGRLWSNLRRCAGFNVQYFSVIEAQKRGAPHLHATIRGAIPRAIFRQVVAATDYALWWPSFDQAVYVDRLPEWTGPENGYADPDTGELLPTWGQALDRLDTDPDARPAHVMRFGTQLDLQGVIPEHADQAVRYLAKYLTKAIGETHTDGADAAYERHLDRLHAELRWLPCSPRCANWLRYGVQPDHAKPGLIPGQCRGRAHDRATTSASPAGSCRPGCGRARPSTSTKPTAPKSSAKPCCPPAWTTSTSTGWPPRSPCPTGHPGSPGPTCGPTTTPTSASSSTPSANGNAGAPSTSTPRRRSPQEFRQLPSRPDLPRPDRSSASPDDPPRSGPEGWGSGVSAANRAATPQAPLTASPQAPTSQIGGGRALRPPTKPDLSGRNPRDV